MFKEGKKERVCPICGATVCSEMLPFCSKRCADIDLGRWLQGSYAIPAVDAADDSIIDAALLKAAELNTFASDD